MSSATIPVNTPDPFVTSHASFVNVPVTKVTKITYGQVVGEYLTSPTTTTGSNTGTISASQLLCPIVLNAQTGPTGAWVLPTAFQLASAIGATSPYDGLISVGDVIVVPVYPLSTNVLTGAFYAGAGSAGFKNVPVYSLNQNQTDLIFQFTGNGPTPSQYTYTLQ